MSYVSHDELIAAFQEIEKHDLLLLPKQYSPYFIALSDENDPDSPLQFIGTDGVPRLIMAQTDYFALRDWTVKNLGSPVRQAIMEENRLQASLDRLESFSNS